MGAVDNGNGGGVQDELDDYRLDILVVSLSDGGLGTWVV
jgi:hypothetical protein